METKFENCTFANTEVIDAAELAALRKDAERYRWLRDTAFQATAARLVQMMPGEMDHAIDHAMQMDASRLGAA